MELLKDFVEDSYGVVEGFYDQVHSFDEFLPMEYLFQRKNLKITFRNKFREIASFN